MNDLERTYFDSAFAEKYPEFVAAETEKKQPNPKAAAEPKGSRQRAQENAPGMADAGMAFMDMLAGALKGVVEQTLGLPGDGESLYRLFMDGQQKMLTADDIRKLLPPVVPASVTDPQERTRREKTVRIAEEVGELIPVAPIGIAKGVARVLKYDGKGKRK